MSVFLFTLFFSPSASLWFVTLTEGSDWPYCLSVKVAMLAAEMVLLKELWSFSSLGWLMKQIYKYIQNKYMNKMSDWLTDWLVDWLTDWLVDWLIDWLMYGPVSEQQSSQDVGSVFSFDLIWDHHLLHHLLGDTWQSPLLQIQKHRPWRRNAMTCWHHHIQNDLALPFSDVMCLVMIPLYADDTQFYFYIKHLEHLSSSLLFVEQLTWKV